MSNNVKMSIISEVTKVLKYLQKLRDKDDKYKWYHLLVHIDLVKDKCKYKNLKSKIHK